MKKLLLLLISGMIVFSGCGRNQVNKEVTHSKINREEQSTYIDEPFTVKVPEGWKLQGERGKHLIVGHKVKGVFNKATNTYWDLNVIERESGDSINRKSPEEKAKDLAKEKNGEYIGKITVDGLDIYEINFKSDTFVQKQFLGELKINSQNGDVIYDIDFALKNCPEDFYKTSMKILDGVTFIN